MTKVSSGFLLRLAFTAACLIALAMGCQTNGKPIQNEPAVATWAAPTATAAAVHSDSGMVAVVTLVSTPPPTRTPPPTDPPEYARAQSVDREVTLFDVLIAPLADEAKRRRAEGAHTDTDYWRRVDRDLNEGRVNFVLFGYGETHEPPATERAIIGSQSIVSYDLRTRTATIISLTHDIRAPEIERTLAHNGQRLLAVRIDQAYNVGGFSLMRRVLEDATGLAVDFQITFKDAVIQDLIDGVFGGVEVDVPMAFDVHPFYLDGKKYDRGHFEKGRQRLSGRQAIQFIKTIPISEGTYDKSLEHNVRKALIFDGLVNAVDSNYADRGFWLRGTTFVTGELVDGGIKYDFDPVALLVNQVGTTTGNLRQYIGRGRSRGMNLPRITRSKYIVDPAQGDGGVQWINANASVNPLTQRDIAGGVYPSLDMEVPIGANPYGDLVAEYWPSVRRLVKETLSAPGP